MCHFALNDKLKNDGKKTLRVSPIQLYFSVHIGMCSPPKLKHVTYDRFVGKKYYMTTKSYDFNDDGVIVVAMMITVIIV